jgi:hypothetical protein
MSNMVRFSTADISLEQSETIGDNNNYEQGGGTKPKLRFFIFRCYGD